MFTGCKSFGCNECQFQYTKIKLEPSGEEESWEAEADLEKNSREQGKGHQKHLAPTEGGCPKLGPLARYCCTPKLLKGATRNKLIKLRSS